MGELIDDINEDGIVNIFDLVIAVGSFRKMGTDLVGDVNGDNLVNIFDLVIIAGSFGQLLVSPSTASEIMLTTQQKRDLALIVDQLLVNSTLSCRRGSIKMVTIRFDRKITDDNATIG